MKLISTDGYSIFDKDDSLFFSNGNQFFQFDFNHLTTISKLEYLIQKYGDENKFWTRPFDEVVRLKNGDFITTYYQEGKVRLHKSSGKIKKELDQIDSPFGMGIYGMTIDQNDKLWIAVPVEHYVGKFDYHSGEEIFSINGVDMEPTIFDHPENVIAIGDAVFVSDMGNKRIIEINPINHEWKVFKKLEEPVYYFNQVNGYYIYLLQSGIYISKK